jgi:hypothetical protein
MCSVAELHNKTEDRELHLSKTGNRSNCKNTVLLVLPGFLSSCSLLIKINVSLEL